MQHSHFVANSRPGYTANVIRCHIRDVSQLDVRIRAAFWPDKMKPSEQPTMTTTFRRIRATALSVSAALAMIPLLRRPVILRTVWHA